MGQSAAVISFVVHIYIFFCLHVHISIFASHLFFVHIVELSKKKEKNKSS